MIKVIRIRSMVYESRIGIYKKWDERLVINLKIRDQLDGLG